MLKDRIKELATDSNLMESLLILEDLREHTQGYRNRLLIVDSQIEAMRNLLAEVRGIAEILKQTAREIPQIADFDQRLQRLTTAILEERAAGDKEQKGGEDNHEQPTVAERFMQ